MKTESQEAALAVFMEHVISDEGLDFPNGAAIVPDERNAETASIVWRCLHEGRPTVLVGPTSPAMLIEPIRPRILGRLRNGLLRRVTVQLSYRYRGTGEAQPSFRMTPPVRAEVGRCAFERDAALA